MFSRIAIPRLDKLFVFSDKRRTGHLKNFRDELDWLLESDVIFDPEKKSINKEVPNEEYAAFLKFENLANKVAKNRVPEANKELEQLGLDFPTAIRRKDEFALRLANATLAALMAEFYQVRRECIRLRILHKMDAYPVVTLSDILSPKSNSDKDEVIRISLNSFPVPNDSTSWEQIIEYRSDPDSQSKFLALRHWMSEVAKTEHTPAEIEEKIEYLINQYERHMKLHRMKTNTSTLQTFVVTSAEVLGDLVSFKWGKAAQALFSLKHRQIALMEGELTSPGSEVAYIVKARETFNS